MDDVGIIAEVRLNGKPHKPPETVMLFGEMTFSNVLHRLDESLDDENGVEVRLYSNANKIGNGTVAHLHDPASTFAKLGLHFVVFQVTAEQPDAPAPPADDIGNDTMAMLTPAGEHAGDVWRSTKRLKDHFVVIYNLKLWSNLIYFIKIHTLIFKIIVNVISFI